MARFRVGLASVALVVSAAVVPVVVLGGGAANAAPGGDITAVCGASATPAPTYTLKTDCGPVTSAVTVPDTITTVNGAGHTISANATDASGGPYTGAVLTNLPGNHGTMNIENLTITGPTAGFTFTIPANTCSSYFPGLFGIFFNDDSGTATNVNIFNMFQTRTPTSPACVVGHSIRADGLTAPRTVNITTTHVSNYQRGGMFASGMVTVNVSDSTIGPGSSVPFSIAQNAVQWSNCCSQSSSSGPPSGSITGSTIIGTNYLSTGPANPSDAASTAVLLYGAKNVTVDHNTIEGSSDIGINVTADTTGATISFNKINRPTPPNPDTFGIGTSVDPSEATLICNTWSGWHTDLVGALQISCGLPDGTECKAYSADLTVKGGTEPFDFSASGTLPPGLHLASTGIISGTPIKPGTYNFTAKVSDSSDAPLHASQAQSIVINADPTCTAEEIEKIEKEQEAPAAGTAPITKTLVPVTG